MYAGQLHRGEEIGLGDFAFLHEDEQQTWKLPIEVMVDLPHLRTVHPVVTVAEYLHLHHLPISIEKGNGQWGGEAYLASKPNPVTFASLKQSDYEPSGVDRVDYGRAGPRNIDKHGGIYTILDAELGEAKAIDLDKVKSILKKNRLAKWSSERELESILHRNGWALLSTYRGV